MADQHEPSGAPAAPDATGTSARPARSPRTTASDSSGPGARRSALPAAVRAGVLGQMPADALMAALHDQLALALLLALVAGMLLLTRTALRSNGLTRPVAVVLAAAGVQFAALLALTRIAPFRVGLLSLLLYCAPALLAAMTAAARSHRARFGYATAGICIAATLGPLARFQQHTAAAQWITTYKIDARVLQVVDLPGTKQEPYQVDPATRQLTAIYQAPIGGAFGFSAWIGVETVTPGASDPCGPLQVAIGDGIDTETPPYCVQAGPSLWQRGDATGVDGYVLYRDGTTITLTGPDDSPLLLAALEAARRATDADLWSRTAPEPSSLQAWLLQ